ncbi:hypothetical protein KIW84_071548 [Lathyrus oleraceus]|uniref:Reverse transcriptase zinc-binding domain-containing protein n=1 Tax=Pisum sativum TaxID=3888 RepID=A0A9D4VJ14_PEA|nr:hypothetical protein KIW84_071548 [Pisum sativum]
MEYGDSLEDDGFTVLISCRPENGSTSAFWTSRWIDHTTPKCLYPGLFDVSDMKHEAASLVEFESALKTTLELIWNTKIPMKVKIFGWRLLLDRLPTRSNLVVRGAISNIHDKVCVFCFNFVEDNNHVFISYPPYQTGLEEGCQLGWDTLDD